MPTTRTPFALRRRSAVLPVLVLAGILGLIAALGTPAQSQREETSPPPSALGDAVTPKNREGDAVAASTREPTATRAPTATRDASALMATVPRRGDEVILPRRLLWRIRVLNRGFERIEPASGAVARSPRTPSASGTPVHFALPGPDLIEPDGTRMPSFQTLFTAKILNTTGFELTSLTLELQVYDRDSKPHSERTEIDVTEGSTGTVSSRGKPFPAFVAKEFSAPAPFPRQFVNKAVGYFLIVRGARGVAHHYSAESGKALLESVMRDDGPTVDVTLTNHPDALAARDQRGYSALQIAAENESDDAVLLLLKHGAVVDERTPTGDTALWLAAHAALSRVIDPLCAAGANVNAADPTTGNTPLHEAVLSEKTGTLHAAVSAALRLLQNKADPTLKNKNGTTPADLTTQPELRTLLQTPPTPATGQ